MSIGETFNGPGWSNEQRRRYNWVARGFKANRTGIKHISRRKQKMSIKRFFVAAAVMAVAAVALVACGGGSGPAAPAPLAITIHAKDIAYDTTSINAKAGQTVNVTYVNDGALDHTFLIDNVITEQKVAAGATTNFSFVAPAAGTYTYYCNVAGHKEAGMVGTLTVTP
jgi:plastocyanin